MAEAIPVADPGLLAAQAKGGQAGVDAYHAAIASMQQQKQQSVQMAMQEAALRGSPQGAAESQSGIIAAPYDQRIASLTQGLGSYQASQASREARMADYNQGVQGARSFIPLQTEQIVAPIRAQGEYNVRNIEMEGRMRVSGIDAETRLALARMAAEEARRRAEAAEDAAKEAELTQGELSGLMTQRARESLGGLDRVRGVLSANRADIVRQGQEAAAGAQAATRTRQKKDQDRNLADLKRAQILTRASDFAEAIGAGQRPASNWFTAARGSTGNRVPPNAQPGDIVGHTNYLGQPIYADQVEGREELPPWIRPMPQRPNPLASLAGRSASRRPPDTGAGAARTMAMGLVAGADRRGRATQQEAVARTLQAGVGGVLRANREYTAIDEDTGRRVAMSPAQVQSLDPFTREMLMGATQFGGINGPQDFEETVWGSPTADRLDENGNLVRPGNRGVGSPYSSDVVQNAMVEAARQLQEEGYGGIDEASVANALPGSFPSIYNMLAEGRNQPSSEEAYQADVAEQAAEEKARGTEDKAMLQKAEDKLAAEGWGRKPPSGMDAVDFWNTINDPQIGTQIDEAEALVQQLIQTWGLDDGPEMSFDEKGKPLALNRDRLREALRQSNIPPHLWEIALMRSGY